MRPHLAGGEGRAVLKHHALRSGKHGGHLQSRLPTTACHAGPVRCACFGKLACQQQGVLCVPEMLLGGGETGRVPKAAGGNGAGLQVVHEQLLGLRLLAAVRLLGQ